MIRFSSIKHSPIKHLFFTLLIIISGSTLAQLNTNSLMYQGRHKLSNDQYFDAIKIFSRIIQSQPETQEAYFFRGLAKFYLSDYQGAKKDFVSTIQLNPFYSHAYHYLAITENCIGNYSKSFLLFKKAIHLSPYDADIYYNRAITQLQLKQIDLAINDLDSAIMLQSNYSEAYFKLSIAYEEKGDDVKALSYVNKALGINPFMGNAYLKRALLKYKVENLDGALADIEKSQQIDKNNPLVFYYKANIYLKQKVYDKALVNYNKVLSMDPENALVYYNRAVLKSEMKDPDAALGDYTTALNINPQNILIYYARALEYFNQNEYQLAISDLNKTLEIYPFYPKAYLLRGKVYAQIGEKVKANGDYLTYQRIVSDNSIKVEMINDSLFLEKLTEFKSDFINVDKVKNQKVQYKDFDLNLLPDVFYFMRQTYYNNDFYGQFKDVESDGERHQMVYYTEIPNCNLDSTIKSYLNKEVSFFNYFVLGTCFGLRNDFNEANAYFTKAIALNPQFSYAYLNRAYFNSKLNDYLADIDNRTSQTLSIDGKLGKKTSQVRSLPMIDDSKIINDLMVANSLIDDVMMQYNLGNALAIHQDFMDAIFWYNKSLLRARDLKEALFNKALVQIRIHDQKSACKSLSKAGELGLEAAYPVINRFCKE